MSEFGLSRPRGSSPYHNYFQLMFEGADVLSSYWQPAFKSVGRSQLEFAGLAARQGQALMQWGRNVSMTPTPAGILAANIQFWQTFAEHISESTSKMTAAFGQAAPQSDPFELVTLPVKRVRDTIVIPGLEEQDRERRVA